MEKEYLRPESLPQHIAVIMDGNGRWAKQRGLPRSAGHKEGTKALGELIRYCRDIGIRYLTVYAFSTENWRRPASEISQLMMLLKQHLRDAIRDRRKYVDQGVQLLFIGDRAPLEEELLSLMEKSEEMTAENDRITVCIALNYGGRDEICHAARALVKEVMDGRLRLDEIDEPVFARHLYTAGIPDPDLILRPSGEKRSSNFLAWQSAYAEYVFLDVLWPDFRPKHLDEALEEYARRSRRFGGVDT